MNNLLNLLTQNETITSQQIYEADLADRLASRTSEADCTHTFIALNVCENCFKRFSTRQVQAMIAESLNQTDAAINSIRRTHQRGQDYKTSDMLNAYRKIKN